MSKNKGKVADPERTDSTSTDGDSPKKAKKAKKAKKSKNSSKLFKQISVASVPPGAPPAARIDDHTGVLLLDLPQGPPGPAGPQGPRGPEGPAGEDGVGIRLDHAPDGAKQFYLYVDEVGRLCYHQDGSDFLVTLQPKGPGGAEQS